MVSANMLPSCRWRSSWLRIFQACLLMHAGVLSHTLLPFHNVKIPVFLHLHQGAAASSAEDGRRPQEICLTICRLLRPDALDSCFLEVVY